MSRVLFTWELGAHFGHLVRQLPLARELHRRGHELLFAVCDLAAAQAVLGQEGFAFVMAPAPRMQEMRSEDSTVYAELLAGSGFGELTALRAGASGWLHLFGLFRPDVLVADHAPLSLFAARLAGLPTVHLAMGFEMPPGQDGALPVLREWLKPDPEATAELEREVLGYMNILCVEHDRPPYDRLADLYKTDVPLLATFPEIDHFPRRGEEARYIGPLFASADGSVETWPEGEGAKIFVYLRPDAYTGRILEALRQSGDRVVAVIPGLDARVISMYRSDRFRIHTSPVRLRGLADLADLTVIYTGHGMVSQALLAGVPLLMIPNNLEQVLLTQRIERLGAGIGMLREQVPEKFQAALDALKTDDRFRAVARKFAAKYQAYDQAKVIERLANTIERLPAARSKQAAAPSGQAVSPPSRPADARTTVH